VLPGSSRVLVAVAASGRAALVPRAAPAADRDPGVSGCRRCSSHPSSRRLGHWRRPPLSSRGHRAGPSGGRTLAHATIFCPRL